MVLRSGKVLRSLLCALALVGAPLFLTLSVASEAHAAVVSRIQVDGNQRVDDATVIANLTIRPGVSFGAAEIDESITTLFATGLFEDVSITPSGGVLIVRVVENPVISRVSFEGNRRVSDEILRGVVRTDSRDIFSRGQVQRDVNLILDTYRRRGSFLASVEPQVIDRGQNRVDLVFEIDEGQKTEVARITFIGNRSFSDARLRDTIRTKESGLLGFLRSTDTYDPNRLQDDVEILQRFYFDRGFADFRVLSANADYDRERNAFFITITIDEGEQYAFGTVRVDTTLADLDPEDLRRRVKSRPSKRYSAEAVEESLEELTLAANREGYAFAEVIPTGERNFETNTIDVVYRVEQGVQAFIERIEIVGNTTTRDYVIRREFDIAEGDAYNRVLLDRAERRLRKLGFFETVQITTRRGSAPDRLIVVVQVQEQATGQIAFGVGYSTSSGVVGDLSIEERNFLGRGQYVKGSIGGGANQQTAEFSFTEPYLFGRRISGGFDIYTRREDDQDNQSFDSQETGGALRIGLPITESTSVQVFYNIFNRRVDFDGDECVPPRAFPIAVCESEGDRLTSLVGAALVYNTLDNQNFPREGIYASWKNEVAGLGGDARFVRTTAKARYYQEVVPAYGVVGSVSVEGGAMAALDDSLRIQDQFQLGGSIVRGFEPGGIGPRDPVSGDALGGRYYVAGSVEATFPIPFLPPELGFSGAVFADAGSVWGVDPDIIARNVDNNGNVLAIQSNDFDLRASGGLGVLWNSPFGPLRADFAIPFAENEADETQVFRISGGTRF